MSGKGKRKPNFPTSIEEDEDEDYDASKTSSSSCKDDDDDCRTVDYDSVSSPGGSSTASEPQYIRPAGFEHHAQEIRFNRDKKWSQMDKKPLSTNSKISPSLSSNSLSNPTFRGAKKKKPFQITTSVIPEKSFTVQAESLATKKSHRAKHKKGT